MKLFFPYQSLIDNHSFTEGPHKDSNGEKNALNFIPRILCFSENEYHFTIILFGGVHLRRRHNFPVFLAPPFPYRQVFRIVMLAFFGPIFEPPRDYCADVLKGRSIFQRVLSIIEF